MKTASTNIATNKKKHRPVTTGAKDPQKQYQGAANRAQGRLFEETIDAALRYYELGLNAIIEKTPEPMKPLKDLGNGRFMACYEKKAQPDYKGTVRGGQTIVFEAKHTTTDRIEQTRVTQEQTDQLDRYHALGAECFVVVGFNMRDFYRIPWTVWQSMREHFGHKYATPEQLAEYRIPCNQKGVLLILADNKR